MEPRTEAPTQGDTTCRWAWYAGRRWVDNGSTHPRDTDGDEA